MMSQSEYFSLKADIYTNGQQEKIVLLDGMILDGRNRYKVMRELGRVPEYVDFAGPGTPTQFVYSRANHRNMSDSQKAASAALFEPEFARDAAARMKAGVIVREGETKGKAAAVAAGLFGVSTRYVEDAKAILQADRRLFDEIHAGRLKVTVAKRQLSNRHKTRRLKTLARKAASTGTAGTWEIRHGDNAVELPTIPRKSVRLVFADPQYNIGVNYGDGEKGDLLSRADYDAQCRSWMGECYEILTADGTLCVLINAENVGEFMINLKTLGFTVRSLITWYEKFGVNVLGGFTRSSRFLLYCVKDPRNFVFYDHPFSRESDRHRKNDTRTANGGMRLWDDVWGIDPQIHRLVDNSAERLPDFPTQLPLDLLRPIVSGFSEPGDLVVDPFNGSGTTGHACIESGRRYLGIERGPRFVELSRLRLAGVTPGRV